MSDRFPTEIQLGGKLRRKDIDGLLEAIEQDGAGFEWGDPANRPESEEDIVDGLDENGWLVLCDDSASCGEFLEIETYCRKYGIAYHRHNDAKYEFDAAWEVWFPGMSRPKSFPSNQSGDFLVTRETLERISRRIRQALSAKSYERTLQHVRAAHNALSSWAALQELPRLEIVD